MSTKILVTGTAGFIGFHLAKKLLERGDEVVGIDNINDYYDVNLKYARLAETGIGREAEIWNKPVKSSKYPNYTFVRMNLEDNKALYALFGGEGASSIVMAMKKEGIPAFGEVEDAVSSLYALYRAYEKREEEEIEEIDIDEQAIRKIIEEATQNGRSRLLSHEAKQILLHAGLDVPPFRLAKSIDDVIKYANEIGYPVAMKVVSEDIIHKSDVGGVVLNIENDKEAIDAFELIMQNSKMHAPKARIEGVEITKMLPKGTETIIGATTDASFGKVIMLCQPLGE